MKKTLIVIMALLFCAGMALPALAADYNNQGRGYRQSDRNRSRQSVRRGDRNRGGHMVRGRDYDYRSPGHHPRGYGRRPRDRYYGRHYLHRNREYRYDGHWNSWKDWEAYRRRYPDRFRQGGYYREGGHLFFRFCGPSGPCLFFSIGR